MRQFAGIFLFAIVCGLPAVGAAERLVLGTATIEPLHREDQSGFIDRLMTEVFGRVGYQVTVVNLPAERALINANAGIEDGDANRVAGLDAIYPNLVRVPESNMVMEFVAFTTRADLSLQGWSSLRERTVGIIGGWKIVEQQIPEGTAVTRAKNAPQLFALLASGRVDIAIFSRWQGASFLERMGISDARVLEPALAGEELYIYLHKRHSRLLPALAEALRAVKADGTYGRLQRETLPAVPAR